MRDKACVGMTDKVRRFIEDNALLKQGDRVIVALSGGADSVCLLDILVSLKELLGIDIFAAHFNHCIRGEEADRDEAFVTDICDKLAISLFLGREDVPAEAAQTGESVELCARRLRYAFLERGAASINGAKIATAHHMGDNAETVLWNLARGSGIDGLSGIPVKRGEIIRPLLCVTREEIEAYCADRGLRYVTDSTNLSDGYTRNRLRHQVVPVLCELNPGAIGNIARTSGLMREADEYLNKISAKELKDAETEYGLSCERLLRLEPIVLKYAVKSLLEQHGAPVDYRHIGLIAEAMRTGGAVQLGQGFTAVCSQGILRIKSGDTEMDELPTLGDFLENNGIRIRIRGGKPILPDELKGSDQKIHNLLLYNSIPCDIITQDTVLRRRMAGDTFTDPRRRVTKTLKKLMNEKKLPREIRGDIPLIANGSTVLWISGFGTSAQAVPDLTRDGDIILLMGEHHA